MPRQVDHDERRREVVRATFEVLAENGTRGLTFRAVADRMGGSSTLVTHYFPTRQALIDAAIEGFQDWSAQLDELEQGLGPVERLRVLLHWLVPTTDDGLLEERARINLLGERGEISGRSGRARISVDRLFTEGDARVRALIEDHLRDLLPKGEVGPTTDFLRSVTNGVTLSAVEHPGDWPAQRQFAVVDRALDALDLKAAQTGP